LAVTSTPVFPQAVNHTVVTIVNADSTNKKTIYTPGANGSIIEALLVTNTDTGAYTLNIYATISATDYLIGTVNIPASAGNATGTPSVNLLSATSNFGSVLPKDAFGNPTLQVPSGTTLKAAVTVAVTAAKTVTILGVGSDL